MNINKYGIVIISSLFLLYGGIRLGVSSALILQSFEWINVLDLQEALSEISLFLDSKREQALIPFSVLGYIGYLWLMGLLLVVGATGCWRRKPVGSVAISTFMIIYSLLFVNFVTINPKIIHLLGCGLLFAVYHWLLKRDTKASVINAKALTST